MPANTDLYKVKKNQPGRSVSLIQNEGVIKALMIICKFKDDHFDLSPHTDMWPSTLNSMPPWAPSLLSPEVKPDYTDPSVSGYFHEMSMGKLHIIGDVKFYQPQHEQKYYYVSQGRHTGYLAEEILRGVDPETDFSQYDSWDFEDIDRDDIYNEPDGRVDFIMICFRFSCNDSLDGWYGYQGWAGITGSRDRFANDSSDITLDNKIITAYTLSSGTFQNGVISPDGALPVLVHEIGHYLLGGHNGGVGVHGLMDGDGTGYMCSFERAELGWIKPIEITGDTMNLRVPDALTSGIAYKISVPSEYDPEYFLIDNHQRKNFYDAEWKFFHNGPLISKGKGIIISHVWNGYAVRIESAFGMWNWIKEGNAYVYPFVPEYADPVSGETKLVIRKRITTLGIKKNHPDCLGSAEDFFNLNYSRVFSPWSNPNTLKLNDTANPEQIAIELAGQDETTGDIFVNIYMKDPQRAQPVKPRLLNCAVMQTPDMTCHAFITWHSNPEPNITGYEIYRSIEGAEWTLIEETSNTSFTDNNYALQEGGANVRYKIKAKNSYEKTSLESDIMDINGVEIGISREDDKNLLSYALMQNYPNPFNPITKIDYYLPKAGYIKLCIYNMLGEEIAVLEEGYKTSGYHASEFNGSKLASGVYIYRLTADEITLTKKALLLK